MLSLGLGHHPPQRAGPRSAPADRPARRRRLSPGGRPRAAAGGPPGRRGERARGRPPTPLRLVPRSASRRGPLLPPGLPPPARRGGRPLMRRRGPDGSRPLKHAAAAASPELGGPRLPCASPVMAVNCWINPFSAEEAAEPPCAAILPPPPHNNTHAADPGALRRRRARPLPAAGEVPSRAAAGGAGRELPWQRGPPHPVASATRRGGSCRSNAARPAAAFQALPPPAGAFPLHVRPSAAVNRGPQGAEASTAALKHLRREARASTQIYVVRDACTEARGLAGLHPHVESHT